MKIINRYVLKEHVGPFIFALSAATSLLLLQYIARKFGDLVGKGLRWQVIAEFLLLSVPLTVELTAPMAVLVAVLYAFSRLASENEITALRAGGVSSRALMRPVLFAAVLLSMVMLWFNDRIESSANHELATLTVAILRTKPTFGLKDQVVNAVKEGQLYLSAATIARDESGRMRDVTIYDLSDAAKRKTIYAASGTLAFAANQRDLVLDLFDGMTLTVPTSQPDQLDRVYFREDRLKVRDVANSFQSVDADTTSKTDREMSICEMQAQYDIAHADAVRARQDSVNAVVERNVVLRHVPPPPKVTPVGGIGAAYCSFVRKYLHVREAQAAELPPRLRQDTTKRAAAAGKTAAPKPPAPAPAATAQAGQSTDSIFVLYNGKYIKVPRNKIPAGAMVPGAAPASQPPPAPAAAPLAPSSGQTSIVPKPPTQAPVLATTPASPSVGNSMAGVDAKMRLDDARYRERRYGIEIQKKFSLAAACIVFVIVGAPIALRFPRGGIGFVFALSFSVFAIYYVALQAGEATANRGLVSPFWAMWGANVLFAVVGLLMLPRMGSEGVTNRGGSVGELVDATRAWFARRRGAAAAATIGPEAHP